MIPGIGKMMIQKRSELGIGAGETVGASFSFRKINPDYSGPCARVLRQYSTTGIDLFFDSNDIVDVSPLSSSWDYFLVKWHDQSGNGRHLENMNNVLFYHNGSGFPQINNKFACSFNTSNGYLRIQDPGSWYNVSKHSFALVNKMNSVGSYDYFFGSYGRTNGDRLHVGARSSSQFTVALYYDDYNFPYPFDTNPNLLYASILNPGCKVYNRGTLIGSSSTTPANGSFISSGYDFILGGAKFGTYQTYVFDGLVSEFIIYLDDMHASRAAIEENINNFYSII
jgi:hypothetical protein